MNDNECHWTFSTGFTVYTNKTGGPIRANENFKWSACDGSHEYRELLSGYNYLVLTIFFKLMQFMLELQWQRTRHSWHIKQATYKLIQTNNTLKQTVSWTGCYKKKLPSHYRVNMSTEKNDWVSEQRQTSDQKCMRCKTTESKYLDVWKRRAACQLAH